MVGIDYMCQVEEAKTKVNDLISAFWAEIADDRENPEESYGATTNILSEKLTSYLGDCKLVMHEIDTEDMKPIKDAIKRVPYQMQRKIKTQA